tara:strand:- start:303 stop:1715 length:1413 start_codon:yes stop_codon:yes gene_type:complete
MESECQCSRNFLFELQSESLKIERKTVYRNDEITKFKLKGPIYQNQVKFGKKITNRFLDKSKFLVMAIAPTQSGKTGSMISTAMFMCKHKDINLPQENVFIITGLSSKNWVHQTQERFPNQMYNNIYHRNTLDKFVLNVKDKKNVLIIVDECQFACLPKQALHKAFKKAGLMDINNIMKNDVKILLISATPDGIIHDINRWKQGAVVEYMDVPSNYVSINSLLENNQIFQYQDLCGYDKTKEKVDEDVYKNIMKLTEFLGEIPKNHLIRTHNSKLHDITINNFKKCFEEYDYEYLSESNINMFELLEKQPKKHTFIFIKEKLRCSHTINKEHVGILYERYTQTVNDSAIIQGFLGRLTGYHNNKTCVVFTNMDTIDKYNNLIENKFVPDDNKIINEKMKDHLSRLEDIEAREEGKEVIEKIIEQRMEWKSNSTRKKHPYTKGTFMCVEEEYIKKKFYIEDTENRENREDM